MHRNLVIGLAFTAFGLSLSPAGAFELSFKSWGDIPLCTSGQPGLVPSPVFSLKDVPAGTKNLKFVLKDLDVPSYRHGGGTVALPGGSTIPFGSFQYRSPCPPKGAHIYQWTVTALGDANAVLGAATARKRYP